MGVPVFVAEGLGDGVLEGLEEVDFVNVILGVGELVDVEDTELLHDGVLETDAEGLRDGVFEGRAEPGPGLDSLLSTWKRNIGKESVPLTTQVSLSHRFMPSSS